MAYPPAQKTSNEEQMGFEILKLMKMLFGDGRGFAHINPASPEVPPYQFGWMDPVSGHSQTWYGYSWADAWQSYLKSSVPETGPWVNCDGRPFVDENYFTVTPTGKTQVFIDATTGKMSFDKPDLSKFKLVQYQPEAVQSTSSEPTPDPALDPTPMSTVAAALQSQPDPNIFETWKGGSKGYNVSFKTGLAPVKKVIMGTGVAKPHPKFAPEPEVFENYYEYSNKYPAPKPLHPNKAFIFEIVSDGRQEAYVKARLQVLEAVAKLLSKKYIDHLTQVQDDLRQDIVCRLSTYGVDPGLQQEFLHTLDTRAMQEYCKPYEKPGTYKQAQAAALSPGYTEADVFEICTLDQGGGIMK